MNIMTKKQQNWNIVRGISADFFFLIYQGTFYIANIQIGAVEVRALQKLISQKSLQHCMWWKIIP